MTQYLLPKIENKTMESTRFSQLNYQSECSNQCSSQNKKNKMLTDWRGRNKLFFFLQTK